MLSSDIGRYLKTVYRAMRIVSGLCRSRRFHKVVGVVITILKILPLLFEASVLIWEYYAYCYLFSFEIIQSTTQRIWALFWFHATLGLCLMPYFRLLLTPLHPIPEEFQPNTPSGDGCITPKKMVITGRFCHSCRNHKPERSHHCSICSRCVLKMDHHCPWFNTCVSFTNYKYFVQYLGYAAIHCAAVAMCTYPYFGFNAVRTQYTSMWADANLTFLFLVALFFGLAYMGLFLYHIYLTLYNATTLEWMSRNKSERYLYHLGWYRNFLQVFGQNKLHWFLPTFTSLGDGVNFPKRCDYLLYGKGDIPPV